MLRQHLLQRCIEHNLLVSHVGLFTAKRDPHLLLGLNKSDDNGADDTHIPWNTGRSWQILSCDHRLGDLFVKRMIAHLHSSALAGNFSQLDLL